MTEEEIKVADWIIKTFNTNPRSISHSAGVDNQHVRRIADYLHEEGLLVHTKGAHPGIIQLTPKGEQFQKSGKSYADYLKEKQSKAEQDEYYKRLQIEKLEKELRPLLKRDVKPARKAYQREDRLLLAEKKIEDRRRRSKVWAVVWFILILSIILVPLNWYFIAEVVDWNNAKINNPFTWANPDKYAKGELIIGIWLGIDGLFLWNWKRMWVWFSKRYYNKFNLNP